MFELFTLIGCAALGGMWKARENAERKRVNEEERRKTEGTNYSRQLTLYARYMATGCDEQGNPLKEPHKHPAETMRIVRKQLESEGIRWYNEVQWNMDTTVFDEEGHVVSIGGHIVDRETGRYLN